MKQMTTDKEIRSILDNCLTGNDINIINVIMKYKYQMEKKHICKKCNIGFTKGFFMEKHNVCKKCYEINVSQFINRFNIETRKEYSELHTTMLLSQINQHHKIDDDGDDYYDKVFNLLYKPFEDKGYEVMDCNNYWFKKCKKK